MFGVPAFAERNPGLTLSRSDLGESASTSAATQPGNWRPMGISSVTQEDYRKTVVPSVILTPRMEDLPDGTNILVEPQAGGLGVLPQFLAQQDELLGGFHGGPRLLRPNMIMLGDAWLGHRVQAILTKTSAMQGHMAPDMRVISALSLLGLTPPQDLFPFPRTDLEANVIGELVTQQAWAVLSCRLSEYTVRLSNLGFRFIAQDAIADLDPGLWAQVAPFTQDGWVYIPDVRSLDAEGEGEIETPPTARALASSASGRLSLASSTHPHRIKWGQWRTQMENARVVINDVVGACKTLMSFFRQLSSTSSVARAPDTYPQEDAVSALPFNAEHSMMRLCYMQLQSRSRAHSQQRKGDSLFALKPRSL